VRRDPASITVSNWRASPNPYTLGFADDFSGGGSSLGFSSAFSAAVDIANTSDCDVTVTMSVHFSTTGPYGVLSCFTYGIEGDPYVPWAAGYGWGAWTDLGYDFPRTDNPIFYLTIPAHSVYPLYIEAYGMVGTLSFSY